MGHILVYKNALVKYFSFNNNFKITKIVVDDRIIHKRELKNIDKYDTIDIEYLFNNKVYNIVYSKFLPFEKYTFPIYNELVLLKKGPFDITDESIILLTFKTDTNKELIQIWECNEHIVLDIFRRYSGPNGNFYKDKEDYFNNDDYKSFMKKYYLTKINEFLNITHNNFNVNIELLYSDGNIIEM